MPRIGWIVDEVSKRHYGDRNGQRRVLERVTMLLSTDDLEGTMYLL